MIYRNFSSDSNPRRIEFCHKKSKSISASLVEERKRTKYREILQRSHIQESRFIPFVFETTGRLGRAATDFLKNVVVRNAPEEIIFNTQDLLLLKAIA